MSNVRFSTVADCFIGQKCEVRLGSGHVYYGKVLNLDSGGVVLTEALFRETESGEFVHALEIVFIGSFDSIAVPSNTSDPATVSCRSDVCIKCGNSQGSSLLSEGRCLSCFPILLDADDDACYEEWVRKKATVSFFASLRRAERSYSW